MSEEEYTTIRVGNLIRSERFVHLAAQTEFYPHPDGYTSMRLTNVHAVGLGGYVGFRETKTHTDADGWLVKATRDCKVDVGSSDPSRGVDLWAVTNTWRGGGSTGRDAYPDGDGVTAEREAGGETISFYMTGCFTGMVKRSEIEVVSAGEWSQP